MSEQNENNDNQIHQNNKTQEQQLEDLYGYYNQQSPVKDYQYNEADFNHQQNLYEGCHYDTESYYEHIQFNQYQYNQYQQSNNSNLQPKQHQQLKDNSFQNQYQHFETHSQPSPLKNKLQSNTIINRKFNPNYSQQQSISRSLDALVSATKKKKKNKNSKSQTQNSNSNSTISTRNKILLFQKDKKKNGDNSIEPIFFNPLSSPPNQAMDIQAFYKKFQLSHSVLINKISQIFKKLIILGQKGFFKDKQNQKDLNQIFKAFQLKPTNKMGKSKSFRQFKALYKYINPEINEGSAQKQKKLGEGACKIDVSYLNQFKILMGCKINEQQLQAQSSNKSLFGYGFEKLKRKR